MKAINLVWAGQKLTIVESDAFALGEEIEEIITLSELAEMGDKPKFRKLARCYAAMINFAGGKASPEAVHRAMMDQIKGGGDGELIAATAISGLIEILMDGAPEGDGADGDAKKKSRS